MGLSIVSIIASHWERVMEHLRSACFVNGQRLRSAWIYTFYTHILVLPRLFEVAWEKRFQSRALCAILGSIPKTSQYY